MEPLNISTEAAKYLAIANVAELLKESLVVSLNIETMQKEYSNKIFTNDELNSVKRSFLRMCSEI